MLPRDDGHRPDERSGTESGEDGLRIGRTRPSDAPGRRSSTNRTKRNEAWGRRPTGRPTETEHCRGREVFGPHEQSGAPWRVDGHRPLPRNGAMPSEAGLRVGGTKRGTVEWGRSSAAPAKRGHAERSRPSGRRNEARHRRVGTVIGRTNLAERSGARLVLDRRTGAAPTEGRRPFGRPTEAKHRRGRAVGLPAKRPRRSIVESGRSSAAPAKRRHTERSRPSGRRNEARHHGTGTVIGRTIEVGLYRGMQAKHHGSPRRTVSTAKASSRGPGRRRALWPRRHGGNVVSAGPVR
jgi:hypothetical protein